MPNFNVANFFRSFLDRGADNRVLIGYDSMSSDAQSLGQSTSAVAIMETWDIPNLVDGSPGIIGFGTCGVPNGFTRLWSGHSSINLAGQAGWTYNASGSLRPKPMGGTTGSYNGSTQLTGGPSAGGDYGFAPQPYADLSIARGDARTAFVDSSANSPPTGCLAIMTAFGMNTRWYSNGTFMPGMLAGGCPFSGLQTHSRLIWASPTNDASDHGAPDMILRGCRQLHTDQTISTNNTARVSSVTADFSNADSESPGSVGAADVDHGSGAGAPSLWLCNPTTTASGAEIAKTLRAYITGMRVFRSSSNIPLSGTSIASMAQGAAYDSMHASALGILDSEISGGLVSALSNTADQTPNPYCDATNARDYLTQLCGRTTGSGYANKIIIYTGHNIDSVEVTELTSGVSARMKAVLTAIMAKHTANALALGSDAPDFLLVSAEKFYTGYTSTQILNLHLSVLQAAQAYGSKASCIDLLDYTNDGTAFTTNMPWSLAAVNKSATGSGSGPVSGATDVHNSRPGNRYIWRLVWEIGLRTLGYDPGVFNLATSTFSRASSRRGGILSRLRTGG